MKTLLIALIFSATVFAQDLPWVHEVTDTGSDFSEWAAMYILKDLLYHDIDQQRHLCDKDRGKFSYTLGKAHCEELGEYVDCTMTASCLCDLP